MDIPSKIKLEELVFTVMLYCQFRLCITKHRAKPMPLRLRASKGSPFGRAPAIAGERAFYDKSSILSLITRSIIRQTPSKFSSTSLFENRKT